MTGGKGAQLTTPSGTADTELPTVLTWSTAGIGKSEENQLAGGGGFEPPLTESESVLDR